jgi:hypothetical protein
MDAGYDDDDDEDDAAGTEQALAKAIYQMRRLSKGRPWLYTWDSPIGQFQICVGADTSDRTIWRLGVRETFKGRLKQLGAYPDYTDAMLAVCNRKTGWLTWDQHPESLDLPMNSRDWEEIG